MKDDSQPDQAAFGTPFRTLVDHCEQAGLNFHAHNETKTIRFQLLRSGILYRCKLSINPADSVFLINLEFPVFATDAKTMPVAMEFFTRANDRLALGAFQFDLEDGEATYHLGHFLGDEPLRENMVRQLMAVALSMAERYFPGYLRVLFGGETPQDAVFLCELDMHTAEDPEPPSAEPPKRKPRARRKKSPPKSGESAPQD